MPERVLVTGGAGFVGTHLVDRLLELGRDVVVLDDLLDQAHPTGEARFLDPSAQLIVGDLRDRAAVDQALEGVDTVFHLGGMVGNGQSMYDLRRYIDVNAVGTATLLEAMLARRQQFRRLVVASSMVVYGDGAYRCSEHGVVPRALRSEARLKNAQWEPVCPTCSAEVEAVPTTEDHPLAPTSTYGISKRDQEELSLVIGRTYRLPTIALRYLNIYGSRQALANPYTGVAAIFVARLLNERAPLIFEDGQQRRDFVHVSDVVAANLAAAEAPESSCYAPYNIGCGASHTIQTLARQLAEHLGVEVEPRVTGDFREGDIRHCFADIERARHSLGWEPTVSLAEGMGELVEWARNETPEDATDSAHALLREHGLIR